jgi:virulence factor Mce-like protein
VQKQAPTLGRLLVMAGFALSCFGLLLFLWLAFGGPIPLAPKGYRFTTTFPDATQLAKEADVRISGVSVGKVKDVATAPSGRARVVIQLDERYAPIPRDTRAILRKKTLLGETYVSLTPGHPRSGMLKEDGSLPAAQVAPTVELDQILRTFDPRTRQAFQTWMQTQAVAVKGRGKDISDALGNLAPFAIDTDVLLRILQSQQGDVRGIVNGTGDVFSALTARDDQLRSLIENSNRVFQTTAQRDRQLQEFFGALPTFEQESRKTVERITRFAHDTDPLVTQLRPAARELSPTLRQLQLVAPDLRGLFEDLGPLTAASKAGLPALQDFLDRLRPFLGELDPPLRQLNPVLSFLGSYQKELTSFFANATAATQATEQTPNGGLVHYLRTMNPISPEALAVYPRRLATNRPNPYQMPGAFSQLAQGLPSYDTRQCSAGAGVPAQLDPSTLASAPPATLAAIAKVLPQPLASLATGTAEQRRQLADTLSSYVQPSFLPQLFKFAFAGTSSPVAPPCRQQGKYTTRGGTTQYPHVTAAPNGHVTAAKRGG